VAVLPSLVTVADLATSLGRTFTEQEELQAQALLDQASSVVRGYLRLDVSRATTTDTFRMGRWDRQYLQSPFDCRPGGQIVLPQRPVVEVTEVRVNGTVTHDWWLDDVTLLLGSAAWQLPPAGHGPPQVQVTYTHGWDPVPGDIAAIVMQAVNRALVNPGQVRAETVGGESTTYLVPTSGEALGVLLSRTEQRVLDRYRRSAGSVRVRS
jgi:hypothetical protein